MNSVACSRGLLDVLELMPGGSHGEVPRSWQTQFDGLCYLLVVCHHEDAVRHLTAIGRRDDVVSQLELNEGSVAIHERAQAFQSGIPGNKILEGFEGYIGNQEIIGLKLVFKVDTFRHFVTAETGYSSVYQIASK